MVRKIVAFLEPGEILVSIVVTAYIIWGLELAAPPLWTMVEQGLEAGTRWPGVFLLVAIVFDLCGVYLVTRTLPPERDDQPGWVHGFVSMAVFLLIGSRWLVSLMLVILGLLGLGIDVRGKPPLPMVALVLLIPTLKELVVYRWLSRPRTVPRTAPPADTSTWVVGLLGSLLLLPKRLVLITFIEEGLFADTLGGMSVVSEESLEIAVLLSVCTFIATGLLYFILVYAPLRTPELIRLYRQ